MPPAEVEGLASPLHAAGAPLRFVKFCAVGASGVLVNQLVLWLGRECLFAGVDNARLRLNLALALAISLATVNNFLWNRAWTWSDRRGVRDVGGVLRQFGRYCAAVALGIVVQAFLTNLLASYFNYLLANLCAIAVASSANFAVNHHWTFRTSDAKAAGVQRVTLLFTVTLLVAAFTYFYGLASVDIPSNGDENVYIHITRKTAESGHWLPLAGDLSHLQNTKPPLLFWQGIAFTHAGADWTLWRLRAPSVFYTLATAALFLLLVRYLRRDWTSAALTALLYLAFYSTYRYGRPFLTDSAEVFWLTLPALAVVGSRGAVLDSRFLAPVCFGAAVGIACLYKSFALILPFALALLWWECERGHYRWRESIVRAVPAILISSALALAVFAIWPLADPDPASIWRDFVLRENAGKLGSGLGSYLRTLLWGGSSVWMLVGALLANGGLLAPVLLVLVIDGWRRRDALSSEERLLWIWVLALFVAFSLPSQRSGRYLLPAMPALATLAALAWPRLQRAGFLASVAVGTCLAVVLAGLSALLVRDAAPFTLPLAYWGVLGIVIALGVLSFARSRFAPAALPVMAIGLLLVIGIFVTSISDPAGPFPSTARARLSAETVFVPCNFPSSEEGHRFLLPGADIRSYAEGDRQTAEALAEQYRFFAVFVPLDEPARCSGCLPLGDRYVLRGRHTAGALGEEPLGQVVRHFLEREVLFESTRAPRVPPPPIEACAK